MLIVTKMDGNIIELKETKSNKTFKIADDFTDAETLRKQSEILNLVAQDCVFLGQRKLEKEQKNELRDMQQKPDPRKYN